MQDSEAPKGTGETAGAGRTEETHRAGRMPWGSIAAVVISGVFILASWYGATHLTFFWDDYETVLTQIRSPISGFFQGGVGHIGPISRVLFFLETQTFGLWFPGYILVNALLIVATFWLAVRSVDILIPRRRWLIQVGAIVYFASIGVLIVVQIAVSLEFCLGICLAAASAFTLSRGHRAWVWGGLLLASWLSMSGTFPVNAALVAAVFLIVRATAGEGRPRIGRRDLVTFVSLLVLAFLGGAIGSVIGNLNATDYYEISPDAGVADLVPLPTSPGSVVSWTAYLFTAWTAAPLLVFFTTSTTALTTLVIFFADHVVLFLLGWVVVGSIVAAAFFRSRGRRGAGEWVEPVLPWLLLVPAGVWALLLATARQESIFTPRYMYMWILPVVLTWVLVLCRDVGGRFQRGAQLFGVTLLTLTAVWSAVSLPTTLRAAADLDKPRWVQSARQVEQFQLCLSQGRATPVDDISPGLPAEDLCKVVDYLVNRSLTGRVWGYSG